jgi:hypothetical protein
MIYASIALAETLPQPSRAGLALQGAPVEVLAAAAEAAPGALEAIAEFNRSGSTVLQNGFTRELPAVHEVRLSTADLGRPTPFPLAGGTVTRSPRGGLVWTGELRVAGARALRLHVGSVALPAGTRAWAYGASGASVALPSRLLERGGELWSGIVHGQRAWLEVEIPAGALGPGREARFILDRVLEIVPLDPEGRPVSGGHLETKDHCFTDTACAMDEFGDVIRDFQRAVGRIVYINSNGGFVCSGALLADAEPLQVSQRAFFLTAAHCISTQEVAETAVTLFRFWRESCGGPSRLADEVVGADLLATVPESDSTLLELGGLPPEQYFLPWNPSPNAFTNGDLLDSISHPGGGPQAFARVRAVPECVNDAGVFSTKAVVGAVRGGSSGSPLINGDGELVAQLGGSCAFQPTEDSCDPNIFFYFGRFARAYDAFAPFLEEPPPPPEEEYFTDPAYPGWKFRVNITAGSNTIVGTHEPVCLPETVCVSGALAGRSEVFIRVIGPRPNGKLWPTLVKFTTSRVDIWIRQLSTGVEKHYTLEGAAPGVDELPGLFDRGGFDP